MTQPYTERGVWSAKSSRRGFGSALRSRSRLGTRLGVASVLLAVGGWAGGSFAAEPRGQSNLRFSLRPGALALSACVAQPGQVPLLLGSDQGNLEIVDWSAAPQRTNHVGEFVLRFTAPTAVGSVVAYEPGEIRYLASNVWHRLPPEAEAGRKLQVLPLPPAALVEALQFRAAAGPVAGEGESEQRFQATLPFVTLLPIRLLNLAQDARVKSSSREAGADPQSLVDGWIEMNRALAPERPASLTNGASPGWVMLAWDQPRSFRGLALFHSSISAGPGQSRVEIFTGDGSPEAADGTNGWKELPMRATAPGRFRANEFRVAPQLVESRAVRLVNTGGVTQVRLGEIAVLHALGNSPVPSAAAKPQAKSWTLPEVAPGSIRVDGRDDDWPPARTQGMAMACDADRLYLLYQAQGEAARFENHGTNASELFHTGDALDLQLQTRAGLDPQRSAAAPGDLRLLFSFLDHKAVCVLYEVQTDDLLVLPVVFKSTAGSIAFDNVAVVAEARVEVRREPGRLTLEASVPLKTCRLSPKTVPEIRGDVGRIFSARSEAGGPGRVYWSNPSTNAPADLAGGAELHPRWWGTLRFGK